MIQKEKENEFKKIFTKKRIILSLVFLCFVGVLFCYVGYSVQAQTATPAQTNMTTWATGSTAGNKAMTAANNGGSGGNNWSIGGAILSVLNGLLYAIFKFVGLIVVLAASLFDFAVDAKNFKEVMEMNSIKLGWVIFRDFLNLFFILVLLFSAFCTIFQIEKYHIAKKNILLMVVIMALLVNFSFPVSRFIIDAGNIPMYHFLKVIGGEGGSISKVLWNDANGNVGMQNIILPGVQNFGGISGSGDQTFNLIAAIVFLFLFGVTLLVIAVLMIIRLLVLALLIMSSPVGFVGAIFPAFNKYSDMWWEQLFKQSFFGTIMAFMLYISLLVMEESQKGFAITMANRAGGAYDSFRMVLVGGVTLSIPIILLWIAIIAAQKMGAAGADVAKKIGTWPAKMMGKGAKWAVKAGAKKFERDILAPHGLSPRAFIQGWKSRAQDAEDKSLKPAAGAWRDKLNRVFSLGKEKSHYKDMEEESLINKEVKEMESYATDSEFLLGEMDSLKGKKDTRSQARVAAAVRMLYRNNDQNEFMKHISVERNPDNTREELAKLFSNMGMTDHQVGRNLYELGEIALSKGNVADYGMGVFKNGHYEKSSEAEHLGAALAKFKNLGSQEKMKSAHWNSYMAEGVKIIEEDANGKAVLDADGKEIVIQQAGTPGELHRFGKAFFANISGAEADQANRCRLDFIKNVYENHGEDKIRAYIEEGKVPTLSKDGETIIMRDMLPKEKEIIEYTLLKLKEGSEGKNISEIRKNENKKSGDSAKSETKTDSKEEKAEKKVIITENIESEFRNRNKK